MSTITTTSTRAGGRRLLGGIVVLFGLLLLLDTTGVLPVDGFEVFLAGALVVYGTYRLVTERARHVFWPSTFVLVGAGWLLVEFGLLTGAEAGQFWPLLVVVFGVSILAGRRRTRASVTEALAASGRTADRLETGEYDLVAVFEDAHLDLRELAVETPLAIDAVAVFGDVELIVPEDWVVVPETVAIFGGLSDRRRSRPSGTPDLVVSGVSIFGDIEIRD
jgi:hypothetical protein